MTIPLSCFSFFPLFFYLRGNSHVTELFTKLKIVDFSQSLQKRKLKHPKDFPFLFRIEEVKSTLTTLF